MPKWRYLGILIDHELTKAFGRRSMCTLRTGRVNCIYNEENHLLNGKARLGSIEENPAAQYSWRFKTCSESQKSPESDDENARARYLFCDVGSVLERIWIRWLGNLALDALMPRQHQWTAMIWSGLIWSICGAYSCRGAVEQAVSAVNRQPKHQPRKQSS